MSCTNPHPLSSQKHILFATGWRRIMTVLRALVVCMLRDRMFASVKPHFAQHEWWSCYTCSCSAVIWCFKWAGGGNLHHTCHMCCQSRFPHTEDNYFCPLHFDLTLFLSFSPFPSNNPSLVIHLSSVFFNFQHSVHLLCGPCMLPAVWSFTWLVIMKSIKLILITKFRPKVSPPPRPP